jgi:histidinol dehydrogenase
VVPREYIPAVDKITGPGNTFVTAAKALVRHRVEIDSEAGPSEVVVLADAKANPEFVVAEMLAGAKYSAMPRFCSGSVVLISHISRKKAIMAVTKSA